MNRVINADDDIALLTRWLHQEWKQQVVDQR